MPIEGIKWAAGTPANPRGRKADFTDFIEEDLTSALGVHHNLVEQFVRWEDQYRAPVKQPERNVPYESAANFMLPTTATDVDQLIAKFMQSLHATDNIWTTRALNERWVDAAKPFQDLLTWLDGSLLHMYDVNTRVVMEMVKLGTGIYKTGWIHERRPVRTYDSSGRVITAERIVGRPFVDHVRLSDFVFPQNAYAIDPDVQGGAIWVGERLRIPVARLKWMAESQSPLLPNIDKESLNKIIKHEEAGATVWDQAVQGHDYEKTGRGYRHDFDTDGGRPASVSGGKPAPTRYLREIEFWEIHARFPTQGKDSEDDIIVWYHKPTRSFVRGVYQYYHHGKRPYEVVRYFPGAGFYGIGVCEQTEVFQIMDSDLFNFTWDNVFLANSRMVVAKAGSNIAPGEPFYPGKVWITDDDVDKAFGVFPMAEIYPSLPMLSEAVIARKERRNGIGDLQLGNMQSLPSRTPATTTLSLLQEGSRRPDMTLKNMRYSGLSMVGLRVVQLCQQFMSSPQDVGGQTLLKLAIDMLGVPESFHAAEKLVTPTESAELGLGCQITATSGSKNKETQKQDYLALMQIAGQTSQQLIGYAQIAMQFAGTPVSMLAEQAIGGTLELGKRLLETYDITNADRIIPDTPPQSTAFPAPPLGGAAPAGPNGGAGAGAIGGIDPTVQQLYGGAASGL